MLRNQILLILLLISLNLTSCSQASNKNIEFNQIGWSIQLPAGFKIVDSSGIARSNARGRALVDSSIKKIEPSERKILIVAKKASNTFLSTITPFNEGEVGKWKSSNQFIQEVLYQTLANKFPSIKFDSSSIIETISSLTFNKFVIKGIENDEVVYNSTMLSKLYKGFDFEISYVFVEPIVGKEIEEMLMQSKFTR